MSNVHVDIYDTISYSLQHDQASRASAKIVSGDLPPPRFVRSVQGEGWGEIVHSTERGGNIFL